MERIVILLCVLLLFQCNKKSTTSSFTTNDLNHLNRKLLEIAMVDGFSPPQASRVYSYPHIAFYTSLQKSYPDSLKNLIAVIKGFPNFELKYKDFDPMLCALLSFTKMAKSVVFSENLIDQLSAELIAKAKSAGYSEAMIRMSEDQSSAIVSELTKWMRGDNYLYTRTLERYTSSKKPENWKETPPDYTQGLEPHWNEIRRFVIDTNTTPVKPLPEFSTDKKSPFYQTVNEVYQQSLTLDSSLRNTAHYWDDNPNTSEHRGHLMSMVHKISPPGHWLNIISQVNQVHHVNIFTATKAYTLCSIAMFDGIIDCWKLKYASNVVRPISYIIENIDVSWRPLIQTPPFPEFTSGHSVVSAAAAEVLTSIYGKDLHFVDSTEMLFGFPPRSFNNFHEAAMEVSLSRFYGGIHYKHSVLEGNRQGIIVAQKVLTKYNQ